jgi:hypothetical protein
MPFDIPPTSHFFRHTTDIAFLSNAENYDVANFPLRKNEEKKVEKIRSAQA